MPVLNQPAAKPAMSQDLQIGVLQDGFLACRVSVRGGKTVVLQFQRGEKGIEIAFSARASRQLTEIVEAAAKVAEGRVQ